MKCTFFIAAIIFCYNNLTAQNDTLISKKIDTIVVISYLKQSVLQMLPIVKGTYLFAAKKTEQINLELSDVNKIDNNPRQLFSKVPGIFVYENDGTGNQVNIASRGLDAHRSWEINVRHNDVMTNSDIYGYPASHFNAPTESIQRIEIVRGSGALQYGAQFGGMVNYITKDADSLKPITFETHNSIGSYGLKSTFNSIGGKINKLQYYSYINYRTADGYRENSDYNYVAAHLHLNYDLTTKLKIRFEYNFMNYINHINGGLTDAQFYNNPKQSTRTRNYYSPTIHLPSFRIDYGINKNIDINFISSAVLGSRNSVQFIAISTVKDTFNTTLNSYNPRQVDIDYYNSYSNEIRIKYSYNLLERKHTLITGIRYINNNLIRKQMGKGTTGFDYDLTLTNPQWGRDLAYKTQNVSVFAENLFQLNKRLLFTTGFRHEGGQTNMNGTIKNFNPADIPVSINHNFILFGFGTQYQLTENISMFANWSQAYRPVIFADLIPATILNKTDPRIKDASGSNVEAGIKGKLKNYLNFDLTFFYLDYKNRTGTLVLTDNNNQTYFYKTNTGNSVSEGIELYAELQLIKLIKSYRTSFQLSVFSSTAYIDAHYKTGTVVVSGNNKNIAGNWVESAPHFISRNGLQLKYKQFSSTIQYSYTGKSYADALNTELANASGTNGLIPAYGLLDFNCSFRYQGSSIKLLMNNVLNKQYFTERPSTFPGPGGLYPSDGRSVIISLGIKI